MAAPSLIFAELHAQRKLFKKSSTWIGSVSENSCGYIYSFNFFLSDLIFVS